MEAGDQQLVHSPFVPAGYWSPCASLVWNPVKAPDIRFSSSHFRKQHPRHEKAFTHKAAKSSIFGDVTEVDELISDLHIELENDCRTYGHVVESLRESLINGNVNEAVEVIHDPPSGPKISISKKCSVVRSNLIVTETQCTNTDLSRSQKDDVLINDYEVIALPVHEENESSSIMNTVASDVAHRSATKVPDECTYRGPLVVLPDMSYLHDPHVLNQISDKNEKIRPMHQVMIRNPMKF
ncbi:unnamed protein product [Schistosoma margrebowiei]|uniref:Uncharacterized protein n=1 Tax=Schistosoma margrebowiei TaxID=48269 RepID=A0A183L9F3_9TREM|nr:unnamed protein product [Schistosoma margrebowiei]